MYFYKGDAVCVKYYILWSFVSIHTIYGSESLNVHKKKKSRLKQVPPRVLRPHNQPDRSKEPSNSTVPGLLLVPASHKIDPFNTLPVDERGNSQYLISKRKLPGNYHCQLLS